MPGDPFNVRVFGYRLWQISQQQRRHVGEAVWIPEEPPVWSVVAVSNGVMPVEINYDGTGADNAQMIGIEIPDGKAIRYELQPLGSKARNARIPSAKSRRMTGFGFLEWSEGSTFSFVDAIDLP